MNSLSGDCFTSHVIVILIILISALVIGFTKKLLESKGATVWDVKDNIQKHSLVQKSIVLSLATNKDPKIFLAFWLWIFAMSAILLNFASVDWVSLPPECR